MIPSLPYLGGQFRWFSVIPQPQPFPFSCSMGLLPVARPITHYAINAINVPSLWGYKGSPLPPPLRSQIRPDSNGYIIPRICFRYPPIFSAFHLSIQENKSHFPNAITHSNPFNLQHPRSSPNRPSPKHHGNGLTA